MEESNDNVQYPAAELLAQHTYEDYKNNLDSYNRIYDKVNVALAFCGVILLVLIEHVDFSLLRKALKATTFWTGFSMLFTFALSAISVGMIVYATIMLIRLMESKEVLVFNSIEFRNEHRYKFTPDQAALALILAYTNCIFDLQKKIKEKQTKFDSVIILMAGSVLLYVLAVIWEKGLVI